MLERPFKNSMLSLKKGPLTGYRSLLTNKNSMLAAKRAPGNAKTAALFWNHHVATTELPGCLQIFSHILGTTWVAPGGQNEATGTVL